MGTFENFRRTLSRMRSIRTSGPGFGIFLARRSRVLRVLFPYPNTRFARSASVWWAATFRRGDGRRRIRASWERAADARSRRIRMLNRMTATYRLRLIQLIPTSSFRRKQLVPQMTTSLIKTRSLICSSRTIRWLPRYVLGLSQIPKLFADCPE